MIEESGQVVSVSAQGVLVATVRQSACGQCAAAKGCGQKLLSSAGQGQRFEVMADNPQHLILSVGDRVVLGLAEATFLKASVLAYLWPIVLMLVASLIADGLGLGDGLVAATGGFGLLAGLGVARWLTQRPGSQCQYHPQILRVSTTASSVSF